MYFILFAIPSVLVTLYGFYIYQKKNGNLTNVRSWRIPDNVTIGELAISLVINFAIAAIGIFLMKLYVLGALGDFHTVVGQVTDKQQVKVSCSHSYACNCRQVCSGSGDTRSCSTVCDTCYEHSYDWDWRVFTTVGNHNIRRVDRRGTDEPPRWTAVEIGEHAATERSFTNYLLGDESSLFVTNAIAAPMSRPRVYDYYRINLVIGGDSGLNDFVNNWAKSKRITPFVVIVKDKDPSYFESIMKSFKGGKITDVIFVYSVGDDNLVQWMNVGTYARGFRNNLMISETVNLSLNREFSRELVEEQLNFAHGRYQFVPAAEFEEKKHLVDVPWYVIIMILIVNVIVSIYIHYYMAKNEVV